MSTHIVAKMAVEVDGDGAPVICVHGLGGTSNSFTPQMEALSGKRVVRPDLPCSGRSALSEKPTIAGFANTIAEMAGILGIRGATLIGHSMGAIVCQHIAAERPEIVGRMILIGALIEPPDAARDGLRQRAATARTDGLSGIADTIAQASIGADTKRQNQAAVAFVRETIMRQNAEGYARCCEALAGAYSANQDRIKCPVLMITGEEDVVAPPSVARELGERIADARVVILPRCGHWPMVERTLEVNAEIRRFS
jgi:3-oxoadipate enol-lactonase